MESQHSECPEAIKGPLYIIPPLPASVQFVLASSDTEIAPKRAPRAQNLASPFLHQDMVQSDHKTSDWQLPASRKRYQKFSQIRRLLPGLVCVPSWPL